MSDRDDTERNRTDMLDVGLVIGRSDHALRLPVSSARVVDRDDGRLEIKLNEDGIDEYRKELQLDKHEQ